MNDYSNLTVAELKAKAKDLFVSPLPRTKDLLVAAIVAAEVTAAKVAAKAPERAKAAAKLVEQEHAVDSALDEAFGEAGATVLEGTVPCDDCGKSIDVYRSTDADYYVRQDAGTDVEHECDGQFSSEGPSDFVVERDEEDFCEHGLAKERCDQHETPAPAETGNRSLAKATKFKAEIERHGWKAEVTHEGDDAEVIARRSGEVETIYIRWISGVFQYPSATYTYAARTVVARNASAMKKRAAMTPEECRVELERVESNRAFRRSAPVETRKARLPFDPESAKDEEVMAALLGKGVKWTNRISNRSESAVVGRDPRRISIVPFKDERIVKFCCPVGGFRAFRLSDLLVAGRPVVRKTTPAESGGATLVVDVEAADA